MQLAPDLDDQVAALKLARAHEHIDDLALKLRAYLASEPYRVVQEAVPGGFRLILQVTTQPPPALALMVGDALHNLRSALDVRLVSLAEHLVGPLNEDQEKCLQLPDGATPQQLAKQTKSWGKQFTPEIVASLRSAVAPLLGHDIDPLYWMGRHGGSSSDQERNTHEAVAARLRRVNRLSNIDKHRRLHLPWLAPDSIYAFMREDKDVTWTVRTAPWSDGDEVARVVGDESHAGQSIQSAVATLTVVLPEGDFGMGGSAADELENLAWFVEQALRIVDWGQRRLDGEGPAGA